MNPSIETPAKLRLWKNSCLGRPKNPSAAALSGEQPFALIERVRLLSVQMRIHSGRHYRWPGWLALMERFGLTRSMGAKGCSPDNAAAEGFFGRMKTEAVHPEKWEEHTRNEVLALVDEYIRWYNRERIKQSLGWMSPVQYRQSQGMAA